MKKYLFEIFLLIFIIIPFIYLGIYYDTLPERVPTHFGLDGTANGWSQKSTLWVMPAGICALLYVVMFLIPILDPKKRIALMGQKIQSASSHLCYIFLFAIHISYLHFQGGFTGKSECFLCHTGFAFPNVWKLPSGSERKLLFRHKDTLDT